MDTRHRYRAPRAFSQRRDVALTMAWSSLCTSAYFARNDGNVELARNFARTARELVEAFGVRATHLPSTTVRRPKVSA
jgi:hypothetical protein